MNTRIVVGVDEADNSLVAVDAAVIEAELRGLPLHVLYADAFAHSVRIPADERQTASGIWALDRAMDRARSRSAAVEIDGELVAALPQRALINATADAALVVIGDRGLNAVQRVFVDSIAGGLATHAACPVLVACGSAGPDRPVVLGIGDSPGGTATAEFAFAAADLRRVGLIAVHAWSRPTHYDTANRRPAAFDDDAIREGAERLVAEALAGWTEKYPDVPVRQIIRHGHPQTVLAEAATDAGLLVIGIRDHGLATEMGLGSLSTHMLHHSPVPVVVVPRHGAGS